MSAAADMNRAIKDFDVVVIGGGVTGLMSAVRLAAGGHSVAVLERDRLGCGATTGNHGLVHSGALYSRLHPEIVAACRDARLVYVSQFSDCLVESEPTWYLAMADTLRTYKQLWRSRGIAHADVDTRQIREVINDPDRQVRACAVQDTVIDTRSLVTELAGRAVAGRVVLADRNCCTRNSSCR